MSDLINLEWRSIRIFSKKGDATFDWCFDLLSQFAIPFAKDFSETPFWFTRYCDYLGKDRDNPTVDLKPEFLVPSGGKHYHFSIRVRFVATAGAEKYLKDKVAANENYTAEVDEWMPLSFAEDRVYTGFGTAEDKQRRANLVGQIICWNARFALDTIKMKDTGKLGLESNSHAKITFPLSFWFPLHMICNVYGWEDGMPLLAYVARKGMDQATANNVAGQNFHALQ